MHTTYCDSLVWTRHRSYDLDKKKLTAFVETCNQYKTEAASPSLVGIAFIGLRPPRMVSRQRLLQIDVEKSRRALHRRRRIPDDRGEKLNQPPSRANGRRTSSNSSRCCRALGSVCRPT